MNLIEILLLLFLFAVICGTLAAKIKMSVEIFLLLASLFISFLPGLPVFNIKPDMMLILFLPPIIFSAAFFTSWRDFVANIRAISLLAVGLVLFTMCLIAATMKLLIPTMSWSLCFLLGAIVSPTDASSAVSLVKKMGIPRRLITIIEGESLINDATALVAFRYALAAVMTGNFSFWDAGLDFLFAGMGGIILGLGIGFLSTRIYAWLAEPKLQNIFSLIIPYSAYIFADRLDMSGIICLVTAGIYFSRKSPVITSPESRHQAQTIWEIFIFAINALIFIIIGLQLPTVVQGLSHFTITELIFYALIINVVIILIRYIWVYPAAYIPRFLSKKLREKDPYPHWTQLATLSWIGMRGILSLILVLSLPHTLPSGLPFPYRSLIILLTYSVILVTVLLPALTLPKLSKLFKFARKRPHYQEEAEARIEGIKTVLIELEVNAQKNPDLKKYTDHLRERYQRQLSVLQSNLQEAPFSTLDKTDQKIRKLTKTLIDIERNVIIDLRQQGAIHDDVFHRLERELDIEELRLKTQRI